VEEYIAVVRYAHARNIEVHTALSCLASVRTGLVQRIGFLYIFIRQVIPEIDMPGHSRAAVVSMEARPDDTYRLLDPGDTTALLTVQYYDRRCVRRGACCEIPYGEKYWSRS
jgi:hypothetical protein